MLAVVIKLGLEENFHRFLTLGAGITREHQSAWARRKTVGREVQDVVYEVRDVCWGTVSRILMI